VSAREQESLMKLSWEYQSVRDSSPIRTGYDNHQTKHGRKEEHQTRSQFSQKEKNDRTPPEACKDSFGKRGSEAARHKKGD
jgi:hypothetical protein